MSTQTEHRPRASWAQGLGSLTGRSILASATIGFGYAAAQRSGFALTFVAVAGALAIIPGLITNPAQLRVVRLAAGGMAAVTGTVLTIQLDYVQSQPHNEGAVFVEVALMVALLLAAVGTWVSDWRISATADSEQRERDQIAAERHAELMRLLGECPSPQPRIRLRDLALVAVAARVTGRRAPWRGR